MSKHTDDISFLHGSNTAFIEALFESYSRDPNSVEPSWRAYFSDMGGAKTNGSAPAKSNGHKVPAP